MLVKLNAQPGASSLPVSFSCKPPQGAPALNISEGFGCRLDSSFKNASIPCTVCCCSPLSFELIQLLIAFKGVA